MASKEKLPTWIQENVPDDAVWSEYYLIARKEETRSGNRVLVNQTLKEPREATISGKEVKDYLRQSSSVTTWIVLIVIGIALPLLMTVLKEPMEMSSGFLTVWYILAVLLVVSGIVMLVKSRQLAASLQSIDSWEALEPLIESALTEKVYNAEIAARKEEEGEQGAAYAGYFCIPAHAAVREDFGKAKSNFGLQENIRTSLVQTAAALPAEGQKLIRKQ